MSECILTNRRRLLAAASAVPILAAFASARAQAPANVVLTNVSYDPTRELYKPISDAFARQWQPSTGQKVTVRASHGGSGKQADRQSRLPNNSSPDTSTIVFVVRRAAGRAGHRAPVQLALGAGDANAD